MYIYLWFLEVNSVIIGLLKMFDEMCEVFGQSAGFNWCPFLTSLFLVSASYNDLFPPVGNELVKIRKCGWFSTALPMDC